MDDTPQAFVCGFNDLSRRGYRHLPDQEHGRLFKEQSKSTTFSGPGNVYPADTVLFTLDSRHIGSEVVTPWRD